MRMDQTGQNCDGEIQLIKMQIRHGASFGGVTLPYGCLISDKLHFSKVLRTSADISTKFNEIYHLS